MIGCVFMGAYLNVYNDELILLPSPMNNIINPDVIGRGFTFLPPAVPSQEQVPGPMEAKNHLPRHQLQNALHLRKWQQLQEIPTQECRTQWKSKTTSNGSR